MGGGDYSTEASPVSSVGSLGILSFTPGGKRATGHHRWEDCPNISTAWPSAFTHSGWIHRGHFV